ncbi:non-reducing end alpha-L-arabinofuranosidase family hydrolase [Glycomyces tritici]|uniref:non-reducing end alpha-L-arabinofuranosidase n=1 Tax=Glycomyces tritici TaxID=2665176 RepID=A0ABT7YS43_9ACTN|nr:non-reducing end alpha-L-arabinofuranosidase family hydrolase [Glycomyces tritici]MDN3241465.1 non-reducing end alpha-L-arabinofuranosidase family hydrolase [Glycomyces tritici]MDN3242252.1 non-reducing end alpha-L-arabinofuranosidase family hydrolase [Glycomyces tritici]
MRHPTRWRSWIALLATTLAAALAAATLSAAPAQAAPLPSSFQWSSTGAIVAPQQTAPGRTLVSLKDPSVVQEDGKYYVYATTADTNGGWSLTSFGGFTDWSQAGQAQQYHLSQTPIGGGYRAAPQVFYFEPDNQWYLIYQTGLPSFSTLSHPGQPQSASAPKNFMSNHGIADAGSSYILDYWIACDEVNCYLYFNNDKQKFYRAKTTVAEFPNGFGDVELFMEAPNQSLFEATNVYKLGDSGQYLLVVEGIGSNGARYFRSWTSNRLDANFSQWVPLANTQSNPFAGAANVSFPGGAWTQDISHGEAVRVDGNQTMEIDPCNIDYLYQGRNPNSNGMEYSQLPYRLGLLNHTNPTADCGSGNPGGGDSGQLRGTGSNRCLDVPNQSTTNGTQVQIYDCWTGANQQWTYANGELSVYSGGTKKCLDANGGGTTNGTTAIIWSCHGGANQRWNMNSNGTISNAASGLCLDVAAAATANGSKVQLWTCHTGTNQRWTLT